MEKILKKETERKSFRQPYNKPQLKKVRLVSEEAVLSACKTTDGIINVWGSGNCGFIFQCYTVGS